MVSVSVIAFESLAVATILPTAAIELDGFGSSGWAFTALMLGSLVGAVEAGGPSRFRAATRGRAGVGAPNGLNQPTSAYASVAVAANPASVTCGFHLFSATCTPSSSARG